MDILALITVLGFILAVIIVRHGDVSLVLINFISLYKQGRFMSISPSLKVS